MTGSLQIQIIQIEIQIQIIQIIQTQIQTHGLNLQVNIPTLGCLLESIIWILDFFYIRMMGYQIWNADTSALHDWVFRTCWHTRVRVPEMRCEADKRPPWMSLRFFRLDMRKHSLIHKGWLYIFTYVMNWIGYCSWYVESKDEARGLAVYRPKYEPAEEFCYFVFSDR